MVSLQWDRTFSSQRHANCLYTLTPAIVCLRTGSALGFLCFFSSGPSPTSPHLTLGFDPTPPITGINGQRWLEDVVTIDRGQQGHFPRLVTPGPVNGENWGRALCAPIDDDFAGQMFTTPQWSDVVSQNSSHKTNGVSRAKHWTPDAQIDYFFDRRGMTTLWARG